jgi:hypothetical protein
MVLFLVYKSTQKMPNKKKTTSIFSHKKILVGGLATLVILGAAGGGYWYKNRSTTPEPVAERKPTINYAPPTEAEKKEAADNKDRIVKETQEANNPAPTTSSGKKAVTPTITNTRGSVNAYVSGIFEDGGTCTATFTKDGTTLSKSSAGFENVSYTQCAPIDITGFLSSGHWSVTVSYASATAEGSSASQTFEVK